MPDMTMASTAQVEAAAPSPSPEPDDVSWDRTAEGSFLMMRSEIMQRLEKEQRQLASTFSGQLGAFLEMYEQQLRLAVVNVVNCAFDGAAVRDSRLRPDREGPVVPHTGDPGGSACALQDMPKSSGSDPKKRVGSDFSTKADALKASVRAVKWDEIPSEAKSEKPVAYQNELLRTISGQSRQDKSWLYLLVTSSRFEVASALFVLSNCVIMALEIQYGGLELGHNLGMKGYGRSADEMWPNAAQAFYALELGFNIVFTFELALRVCGIWFPNILSSGWFWLDFVLVTLGWMDQLMLVNFFFDPLVLRTVRLLRLLRIIKVLKAAQYLDTLFLLVRSVQASIGALVWSFLYLSGIQVIIGTALCQILRGFINDESNDEAARREIFQYFGTFSHAIVTMCEVTLSNWVVCCRVLMFEVHEIYGIFFVIYQGCFMFAVLKVIAAVFIAETTRCATQDDQLALSKKQRSKELYCRKLMMVFTELDTSGDGYVSVEEFERLLQDSLLQDWLTTLEVDIHDLRSVFEIMDNGDGQLDAAEFVNALTRVRGPAKSIDILKLNVQMNQLRTQLGTIERACCKSGVAAVLSATSSQPLVQ